MTPADHANTVIFTAWWDEEPGKTRSVTAWCKTCARSPEHSDVADDIYLVSPQGIAHHTAFRDDTRTACGHDATGPEWWWRQ